MLGRCPWLARGEVAGLSQVRFKRTQKKCGLRVSDSMLSIEVGKIVMLGSLPRSPLGTRRTPVIVFPGGRRVAVRGPVLTRLELACDVVGICWGGLRLPNLSATRFCKQERAYKENLDNACVPALVLAILRFRVHEMLNTQQTIKAVGYTRVSTDKQADHGVSLEAQVEKIRAMAVVQGAELLDVITDAESAKSLDRPGMTRLLAMVDRGEVQTVIITKLDRITRSVVDLGTLLERFKKHDVSLVSMAESLDTGSAAGRLVMNIMASVSQWEREAIAERTATALQFKRKHHRVFNHTPYGFSRDGDALVLCAEEQVTIGRVKAWRATGWTLQRIADVLNEDGVPTKHGCQWLPKTVSNVVSSSMSEVAA